MPFQINPQIIITNSAAWCFLASFSSLWFYALTKWHADSTKCLKSLSSVYLVSLHVISSCGEKKEVVFLRRRREEAGVVDGSNKHRTWTQETMFISVLKFKFHRVFNLHQLIWSQTMTVKSNHDSRDEMFPVFLAHLIRVKCVHDTRRA